jgi:hypothetical protein
MNECLTAALIVALLFVPGCGKKRGPFGGPSTTSTPSPRAPAPPPPEQPPIREVSSVSEPKDGVVVNVRLFAGTITADDPVRFALGFAQVGGAPKGAPSETLDTSAALGGLTFELTPPKGKSVKLAIQGVPSGGWRSELSTLMFALEVDAAGLHQNGVAMPWKEAASGLTHELGTYHLQISGTLETDKRKLEIASKPIEVEVVAKSDARKSLADIESLAAALATKKESLKAPPKPAAPTIEDVKGNLWTRFQMSDLSGRYDMQVIEILLDPSGKEQVYDSYSHFTCIAAGTPIATPRGEVPVETLHAGDEVISYDVARHVRSLSVVRHVEESHSESLFVFGRLRVTGSHPIFENGEFRPASELSSRPALFGIEGQLVESKRTHVDEPSAVYDLTVSEPHTYFAGGVLVHNKAVHVPLGGPNAPWQGWFFRRAAKH